MHGGSILSLGTTTCDTFWFLHAQGLRGVAQALLVAVETLVFVQRAMLL